jgi:hypothetical protein
MKSIAYKQILAFGLKRYFVLGTPRGPLLAHLVLRLEPGWLSPLNATFERFAAPAHHGMETI